MYRRRDGRWAGSAAIGGARRFYYGRTRGEAEEKLAAALRTKAHTTIGGRSAETVADFLTRWLEGAGIGLRSTTLQSYRLGIRRVLPLIGSHRLTGLTPEGVQGAYAQLARQGLSASTILRLHVVLSRALKEAALAGLVPDDPMKRVPRPRPGHFEARTLTIDEARLLLQTTVDDRLHALWVVLLTTGVRLGEALGLMWTDVDFGTRRLSIRRALQRQPDRGFVLVDPKSAKSRRSIYLPEIAVKALQRHAVMQQAERQAAGDRWQTQFDLIFKSQSGRPMQDGQVSWVFHKALRAASLPKIRLHDLRHTAATLLFERGVHPKIVQELLGHSTINLTLDTYSHVMPGLGVRAAEEMQDLFRGSF